MKKERKTLPVKALSQNTGQLGWLPRNPRQWTQTDIDRTAKSIREDEDFLEDRPLLCVPADDKGKRFVVFGGNMRLVAAKAEGFDTVPCVVYYPQDDDDHYVIKRRAMKDNGSFGSWDYDELANSWDDMPLADLGITAWDGEGQDVKGGGSSAPATEEDDFDEEADCIKVLCKPGEVWQLGDHRLMCGDSVDLQQVKTLMGGG